MFSLKRVSALGTSGCGCPAVSWVAVSGALERGGPGGTDMRLMGCSTSYLTFVIFCPFQFRHSGGCVVVSTPCAAAAGWKVGCGRVLNRNPIQQYNNDNQ